MLFFGPDGSIVGELEAAELADSNLTPGDSLIKGSHVHFDLDTDALCDGCGKAMAVTLTASDGGSITLSTDANTVPDDAQLYVREDAPIEDVNIQISATGNLSDQKYVAYDIHLVDSQNAVIQPNGNVTVKIPIPEGFDASQIKVFYIGANGTATDMNATVEGGFVIFTTDHFSNYVVVDMTAPETPEKPEEPEEPGTTEEPTKPASDNVSKYCGEVHVGFFQKIIGFFHSILALFGLRK